MSAPQSMHSKPFQNKIIYLGFIIVLLIPIYWLGNTANGFLERKRTPDANIEDLGSDLGKNLDGEINMAAETIRLGTFGLDGVAQMLLWQKADEYKKKKDWTKLAATLNQLIMLNPHLESVWRFQGWNLAYNVSVEHDNYEERYFWVKKGIKFLERGTEYNPRSIRVTWDVGWTTSQKISKSDERVFFRRLYRDDKDPNITDPPIRMSRRDSWLVGKWWYKQAESLHVEKGVDLETISPTLFFSYAPLAQAYYADNLEQDGNFIYAGSASGNAGGASDGAQMAWNQFNSEWKGFGELSLNSAFGEPMKLIEQEMQEELAEAKRKELDALDPGRYEYLVNIKRARLTQEERNALNIPMEARSADVQNIASAAEEKIKVSNDEWAQNLPMEKRQKGQQLAKELDAANNQAKLIRRYRLIVNYQYWDLRGELEKLPSIIEARKLAYEADKLYENNELREAVSNYDRAFALWVEVINSEERFKNILQEDLFASDLRSMYDKYVLIRTQDDPNLREEDIRRTFPMKKVLETAPTDDGEVEKMRLRREHNMKQGGYMPGKFI
ncbi:MAG: hypothetical protein J6A23_04655 [Thermoguttaceae bacterium]|nr:hypothetical protein [Thermoguttaceae bacterium]MBP3695167.1 hypothetical protein [Thermoguttaceae bacterium]